MWKFSRRSAVRWSAWLDVSVADIANTLHPIQHGD
jgi:hypothetical protein